MGEPHEAEVVASEFVVERKTPAQAADTLSELLRDVAKELREGHPQTGRIPTTDQIGNRLEGYALALNVLADRLHDTQELRPAIGRAFEELAGTSAASTRIMRAARILREAINGEERADVQ